MIQAFYTGISGLQATQMAIDVTSDNLSNVNTVGFKNSSVEFSSVFASAGDRANAGAITSQSGSGVKVQATAVNLSQGELIQGDRDTELAIDGDGWFGVKGNGNTEYTRNGNFNFDADRNLVTDDRSHVLGTMGNNIKDGVLVESLNSVDLGSVNTQEALNFPTDLRYPVEPTSKVSFSGNLGINTTTTSASSTAISASSENNAVKLAFTQVIPKPASGTAWDIVATVKSADGSTTYDTQQGSVTFTETGALDSFNIPILDNDGTAVSVDLGSAFDGLIANGIEEPSISSSSNGLEGGDLVGYRINQDANVVAAFSNGRSSSVGKVAIFHFQNDQGLEKLSGSRFTQSNNSGNPIFFTDSNGTNVNGSSVLNYRLENSNVRVEVGLTELIVMQRSYDANSKSISTSDEMIQKALNMGA